MSDEINRPDNQRPIDAEIDKSVSVLSKLRLISNAKIKLWHALLVAVFLAGFTGAMAWSIAGNLSQSSQAAGKQPNESIAQVKGKNNDVEQAASPFTVEKSANGKYSFVKLAKNMQPDSGKVFGVNTQDAAITTPPNGAFLKPGKFLNISGTAAGADFASYTLEWDSYQVDALIQPGIPPHYWDWKRIASGTVPVVNGLLGRWLLPRGIDMATQSFIFKLTVNSTSGDPLEIFSRVYLNPTLHEGWPKQMDYPLNGNPYGSSGPFIEGGYVTADIDNDGYKEIIGLCLEGVSNFNKLCVWAHDGQLKSGWPVVRDDFNDLSVPSVDDINGDGKKEIVIGTDSGVVAFSSDGVVIWEQQLGGPCFTPVLASLASSIEKAEKSVIIQCAQTEKPDKIFILDSQGRTVRALGRPSGWLGEWRNTPAVGDINGDGKAEIVSVAPGGIYVWDKNGNNLPGWPRVLPVIDGALPFSPILADINNDSKLEVEVLVGGNPGTVYAFSYLGQLLANWPQSTNYPIDPSTLSIGNITKGGLSIISPALFGGVAFASDGSRRVGWPLQTVIGEGFWGGGTVFDFNHDSLADVLFNPYGYIYGRNINRSVIFNGKGERLAKFISGPEGSRANPVNHFNSVVDDIDNDGKLELITTYTGSNFGWNSSGEGGNWYGQINVFDLDASAASATWPMFQANPQHTGVYNGTPLVDKR